MAVLQLNDGEKQALAEDLKEVLDVVLAVDNAVDPNSARGRKITLGEISKIGGESLDLRGQFNKFTLGVNFMETDNAYIVDILIEEGLIEAKWREVYIYILVIVKGVIMAAQAYQSAKVWK